MSVVIQFFKELGPLRLAIAAFAFLFFILLFSFYLFKVSNQNMAVLYSELELADSNKIVQELEAKKIPYEIAGGGKVIKIPEDQVLKMRVSLAQEGMPGKGSIVGYEIFDKEESLGSTSFLQNVKMLRALEGELVRTIEDFEQVDKARLHLVIPKREIFSKERQEPRASLILKMKNNKSLNKGEVDAISHLVASAVPELELKNITIVDTKGKSLKLGMREESEGGFISSINEDRKLAYENKLKHAVEQILAKTLGNDKVIAQVNVEMNFDRIVSNSETFDQDNAVLRSIQTIEEHEKNPLGSEDSIDVSVANNLPGALGSEQSDNNNVATLDRIDETKNYEISKTITNQIKDVGMVEKISVAVLVDGIYKNENPKNKGEYAPRSEEELKKIEDLVKVAVGFNSQRNDQVRIINMPFASDIVILEEENNNEWIKEELPGMLQTLVIAVVVILIFIGVVRPLAMRAFEVRKGEFNVDPVIKEQLGIMGMQAHEGGEGQEDINYILNIHKGTGANSNFVKKINETAEQYPQETVLLLRRWLNEDGK